MSPWYVLQRRECKPDGTAGSDRVQEPETPPPVKEAPDTTLPAKPVPSGSAGSDKSKSIPKSCPADRPVGTAPNCCPEGTAFKNGVCLRTQKTPAEPQKKDCGPGRVNMGGICVKTGKEKFPPVEQEQVPPPKQNACPPERPVGSYPNCCPPGYVLMLKGCVKPKPKEPPPSSGGGGIDVVPKPKNKDQILTKPSGGDILVKPQGNVGDVLKKTCPKGQELNSKGQCEEVFRAPK